MNKSQTELLQEFQEEIARLKEQISALENRISALQFQAPEAEDDVVDFSDIEIGVPTETPAVTEPVAAPDPVVEPEPQPVPEPQPEPVQESTPKVEDETAHLPWRTDKPGIQVKNIRSGISLLDRALFIGTLFKEDFSVYDQTIAELNTMTSLDQAVDYLRQKFPNWNFKSDVVYRFMMSIRKKLG